MLNQRRDRVVGTIALLVVGTTAALVGCAGGVTVTDDGATVIVTDAGFLTGDEASIQGMISITEAGCVGITDTQGGTYPAVWPRGTSLVGDSEIAIDIPDVGIKRLGDEVNGAGGYYEIGTWSVLAEVAERCHWDGEVIGVRLD
ncbi:hypothetical protein E4U02_11010 [Microbacterium paludicola]|uniref:Uncharacterized protein n=1 Tax=Microbacterium paludicola TaxID=300019 RepID=A0A4Y9FV20_9MICO|nr:hypothetical protein [Microbacterium paludicola]MBF0816942.1 hypothetical protein [Microbacterium paludicola]TFU32386.1 hypothetical protein E4U02_11010 [Microbacterium paludicola]